jgi:hypothetical protein
VTCGTGVQTYKISTPASGGGDDCKDADGTTPRAAGDTKPCSGPVCGVNCVGDWVKSSSTDADGWGACSATCGSGTQTRKYKITTQQAAGGNSCPKADGATETRACPNLPECAAKVNCVGAWGEWTGCSAGCGGGTRSRTYYITTPAANGGTACPKTNGQSESEACNTTACCSAATTGAWYDVGAVICTGSSSPDPYIYQSRAVTFPSNPTGSATAQACNITVAQVRKTAGPDPTGQKCPDRNPVSGTCSLGNPWSTTGCAITPATTAYTAASCPTGYNWFDANTPQAGEPAGTKGDSYGIGFHSADGSKKYTRGTKSLFGVPSSDDQPNWTAGDTRKNGSIPWSTVIADIGPGCYQFVSSSTGGSRANHRWVKVATAPTLTCPSYYTPDTTNMRCNASNSGVSGLTCDSTYFTANNGANKCVAK